MIIISYQFFTPCEIEKKIGTALDQDTHLFAINDFLEIVSRRPRRYPKLDDKLRGILSSLVDLSVLELNSPSLDFNKLKNSKDFAHFSETISKRIVEFGEPEVLKQSGELIAALNSYKEALCELSRFLSLSHPSQIPTFLFFSSGESSTQR